jgi:hypothetical protein
VREITETYVATGAQSLISVKYSAINPADLRHYYMGFHSYVAGYEVCRLLKDRLHPALRILFFFFISLF